MVKSDAAIAGIRELEEQAGPESREIPFAVLSALVG
jgi:hypothetical protein